MAHPALLAFERADGLVDCYESGVHGYSLARGDLAGVTPDDPDLSRRATGVPLAAVLGTHLDPARHEAVVVSGSSLRAYRVLRFAVPTASGLVESTDVAGALVAVHDLADPEPDGYVRGWFESARSCVGEAVDRGVTPPSRAPHVLGDRLQRFAGGDVEVIDLPPG